MPPAPRYYPALVTAFVTILLISNLLAQKIVRVGPVTMTGAVVVFPLTYIFGDIFTEVYGFAASRVAIWLGFFATALLYAVSALVLALPADPGWHNQAAFDTVFGFLPRLLAASLLAYGAGEFSNAYVMARMKVWTGGRYLWTRTVASTVIGQAVDTAIVVPLAFLGRVPPHTIVTLMWQGYVLKVAYESVATPLTYVVVGQLKRAEGLDTFDRHVSFSPFRLTGGRGD